MIVSEKYKYVFMSTPKTGTHSMYRLLIDRFDGHQLDGAYHRRDIPDEYREYFIFTTVRNPYDRTVSIWHALTERENYRDIYVPIIGSDKFSDFVDWLVNTNEDNRPRGKGGILIPTQSNYLKSVYIDKFLQIENIEEQFQSLPFVEHSVAVPKLLSRRHLGWSDLKSSKVNIKLTAFLEEDFANFNYIPE